MKSEMVIVKTQGPTDSGLLWRGIQNKNSQGYIRGMKPGKALVGLVKGKDDLGRAVTIRRGKPESTSHTQPSSNTFGHIGRQGGTA